LWEFILCINIVCFSTLTASEANPGIFRPGQLVEMSINIRALQMGSLHNVVLRMDLLTIHDRYGAGVRLSVFCDAFVNGHIWIAVSEHETVKTCISVRSNGDHTS
jgi:hypothetical protein